MTQEHHEDDIDVNTTLRQMVSLGASDLHLTAGSPPMVRLDGELAPLAGYERLHAGRSAAHAVLDPHAGSA